MMGLTLISGLVGDLIAGGQFLNGEGLTRNEHAFTLLPGNMILEAEPGGARIVPYHYGSNVYWCKSICKLLDRTVQGEFEKRLNDRANELKGIGYSGLDYGALILHRFGINPPGLKAYIASTGHMICSQMNDELYLRLGAHVFDDGRWPGYVTPASLYRRDLELGR